MTYKSRAEAHLLRLHMGCGEGLSGRHVLALARHKAFLQAPLDTGLAKAKSAEPSA